MLKACSSGATGRHLHPLHFLSLPFLQVCTHKTFKCVKINSNFIASVSKCQNLSSFMIFPPSAPLKIFLPPPPSQFHVGSTTESLWLICLWGVWISSPIVDIAHFPQAKISRLDTCYWYPRYRYQLALMFRLSVKIFSLVSKPKRLLVTDLWENNR